MKNIHIFREGKIIIRQASIENLDSVTKVESIYFPVTEAATGESLEQRINTFLGSFFVAETDGKIISLSMVVLSMELLSIINSIKIVHYIFQMEITKPFLDLM